MIPKSVSGSTRIIALGAVLTWPVWGWAGDIGNSPLNRWALIGDDKGNVLLQCDEHYKNCTGPVIEQSTCYQRMREAMRMIDKRFNSRTPRPSHLSDNELIEMLSTDEVSKWQKTMKDCVEGSK